MTPKKQPIGFSSFRVLGKKAQDLLHRAREEIEQNRKKQPRTDTELPEGEEHEQPVITVALSIKSVAKAALAILGIIAGSWLLIQLQEPLLLLLLGVFVAAIIDPGVRILERWGVPRGLGILLHYFAAIFLFLFLIISLVPIMGKQIFDMANFIATRADSFLRAPEISLPLVSDEVNRHLTDLARVTLTNLSINQLAEAMQRFGENLTTAATSSVTFAIQLGGSVLSFFVKLIIVLVLAFFIQIERESIRSWLRGFLPYRMRGYLESKTEAIHYKIGQWVRGQLILALTIAVLSFVALWILGMPYALTLAAFSGFTEFIPYVGPLIGAVPAILIAFTQEGIGWALVVAGVFYVIQWCENNLLVPLIMKRAVGLSPIVIIFAMMVAVSFPTIINPILGILVSVPATTILAIFLNDWREHRKKKG